VSNTPSRLTEDAVVSTYFGLVIDTWDLGWFISCSGLGMEMQVDKIEEGGGGLTTWPLLGRVKYTNLTVTRPICSDTAKTMAWLNAAVNLTAPATAQLSALDPHLRTVYTWVLNGVVPAKWTGPSFDSADPKPATETLELAYGSIMLGQS
jgi:phage tail-like protein